MASPTKLTKQIQLSCIYLHDDVPFLRHAPCLYPVKDMTFETCFQNEWRVMNFKIEFVYMFEFLILSFQMIYNVILGDPKKVYSSFLGKR